MEKDNSLTNKANRIRLSSQQGAEYEPYPHQTGTHAP